MMCAPLTSTSTPTPTLPQAIAFYGKAANQNYAAAQHNLGLMLLNGDAEGGAVDAVKWFHKAAELGGCRVRFGGLNVVCWGAGGRARETEGTRERMHVRFRVVGVRKGAKGGKEGLGCQIRCSAPKDTSSRPPLRTPPPDPLPPSPSSTPQATLTLNSNWAAPTSTAKAFSDTWHARYSTICLRANRCVVKNPDQRSHHRPKPETDSNTAHIGPESLVVTAHLQTAPPQCLDSVSDSC